ncbi:sugar phosphate isomerase/epimerase [Photobacterium sp. ZSDE20]|uniref:Sugar phosphate isomerase/epimerase n=1 Tax=Photobacterium pectinilyticum TaxID=2906793 RepID=A0ABT1N965_9GAMM|nr:sugar phosphate isomerase/epimerase family protein [Photobacterium sp. ZSDE20]MCQ1061279.1 sugar phosphate isomerase/epimerase [Photobacterium sp. ZSDE20]MDD1829739.1 sugar phosphate isomerase/epimerase [Photobacterium sp. ZSDE20]
MRFALHGMCSLHSNILSDIRLAKETGYQGVEIHTEKLWRYINAGFTSEEFKARLDAAKITPSAIDIIGGVEATTKEEQQRVFKEAEVLCRFAKDIGAPTIQLNAFESLNGFSTEENIQLTAKNIRTIADIGREHGIRFQYEGAAWTPIATLDDYYRLLDAVGRDNFGFVLDTWHLWACRGATLEQISQVDKSLIYNVHLSDGKRPAVGQPWVDERELRGVYIGEGDIPMQEWVDALLQTGYDGFFSGEFLNDQMWEHDHYEVAEKMLNGMKALVR